MVQWIRSLSFKQISFKLRNTILGFKSSQCKSTKILTCKSSFLVFIYGVLQGDNFVVGYFYILILIIFLFGIPCWYNVFSFQIKTNRGIFLSFTRISRKSQVNHPSLRMHDLLEILEHAFSLLGGFFQYTYNYLFYNNMCKVVVFN